MTWRFLIAVGSCWWVASPAVAGERLLTSSMAPATARVTDRTPVADGEPVGPILILLDPGAASVPATLPSPASGEARTLAALYGVSPLRYARVRSWLEAAGFRVRRESVQRTSISVEGSAAAVRRAFGTGLERGRLLGRSVRVPAAAPRVPDDLGIRGVLGLDDLPRFRPLHRAAAVVTPDSYALDAPDFARVYRTASLLAAGQRGAGATIAIIARSNYRDDDLTAFAERFTSLTPRLPVRIFSTPGADPGIGADADELEVLLDLQWAGAVAPEAAVRAVIATPAADVTEALDVAVDQRLGDVISLSYGLCEPFAGTVLADFFHDLYARATLQGQTIVAAAGDDGATDCAPDSDAVAVSALASSPYVVAVGGTILDPAFDATGAATGRAAEAAWQDEYGAGGGGVSVLFGPPAFQAALGFRAGRALPDLALAASPANPGYAMVRAGESLAVGGTSAGAPAFAGMLALAVGIRGESLGAVLPGLYELATDDDPKSSVDGAFHDVTDGSNGFAAGVGFDLATGWGTPIGERLVPALAAAPPATCEPAFSCSVPGSPASAGCLVEWRLPDVPLATRGDERPNRRQRCRDGEPCDLDGRVNKSCTIAVALCVNLSDPRLRTKRGEPACTERTLASLRIVRPRRTSGPVGAAIRERLDAALAMLPSPPILGREACTAPVLIDVPVPIGSSFGAATLRAVGGFRRGRAKGRVTLLCERTL